MLQRFSGVSVRRVIDRSFAQIPEHAHDWPMLSLFVMGTYINQTEIGEQLIYGPSAVHYRAQAAHRNLVGPEGFEQIEIEFDPAWLRPTVMPDRPVQRWIGNDAGAEARSLARLCGSDLTEARLRAAVRHFIEQGKQRQHCPSAHWLKGIARCLRNNPALKVSELAKGAHRHPSWLGEAYKRATGEGLPETAARLRVERAACLLRESDLPFASVAADAGFCDQSHMNRTFGRVLGRLPSAVRQEKTMLRRL